MVLLELEEYIYVDGTEKCATGCPMTQCMSWNQLRNQSCSVNCVPFILKSWYFHENVPICETTLDHFCQIDNISNRMQAIEESNAKAKYSNP